MQVILSIKPEFANKIFNGTKKYEFRRILFKNETIDSVIVYASAPISKVIGEFEIDEILFHDIESLWLKTAEYSGISEEYYTDYFQGKSNGYAIKVKNPKKYKRKLCIQNTYGLKPPQSFAYIKKDKNRKNCCKKACRLGKNAPAISL
jgi:predicted transcriptional regulator